MTRRSLISGCSSAPSVVREPLADVVEVDVGVARGRRGPPAASPRPAGTAARRAAARRRAPRRATATARSSPTTSRRQAEHLGLVLEPSATATSATEADDEVAEAERAVGAHDERGRGRAPVDDAGVVEAAQLAPQRVDGAVVDGPAPVASPSGVRRPGGRRRGRRRARRCPPSRGAGTRTPARSASSVTKPSCSTSSSRLSRAVRSVPRYHTSRQTLASSWASHASRPYTLTASGPSASCPVEQHDALGLHRRRRQLVDVDAEPARASADARRRRASARRADDEVDDGGGEQADGDGDEPPVGVAAPRSREASELAADEPATEVAERAAEVRGRGGDAAAATSTRRAGTTAGRRGRRSGVRTSHAPSPTTAATTTATQQRRARGAGEEVARRGRRAAVRATTTSSVGRPQHGRPERAPARAGRRSRAARQQRRRRPRRGRRRRADRVAVTTSRTGTLVIAERDVRRPAGPRLVLRRGEQLQPGGARVARARSPRVGMRRIVGSGTARRRGIATRHRGWQDVDDGGDIEPIRGPVDPE